MGVDQHRPNEQPLAQALGGSVRVHLPVATPPMGPTLLTAVSFHLRRSPAFLMQRYFLGKAVDFWCETEVAVRFGNSLTALAGKFGVALQPPMATRVGGAKPFATILRQQQH